MRSTLFVCFAVALFVQGTPVLGQDKGLELKVFNELGLSAPPGWRLGNQARDSVEIFVPLQKERKFASAETDKNPKPPIIITSEAGMLITVERRRDHAEAVRRLVEISLEYPEHVTPLMIAGWPAIERRYRALIPQPGERESSGGNIETSFTTTAVAVGSTVVRFNTMFAPEANPKFVEQALGIARALRGTQGPADISNRELKEIQLKESQRKKEAAPSAPSPSPESGRSSSKQRPSGGKEPGVAVQVQPGLGELEVASNDGQHVVVAANSGFSFSDNFGALYAFGGGTPCNQAVCDGDPSLAVGNSGAIYYAWIGGPNKASLGDGVSRSTDNGHTFPFQAMAVTCPGTTNCTVADQEHIAADRNNAGASGDRIYNVWRNFPVMGGVFSIRISCSANSGANWTPGVVIGAGDLPRVSVGGDGFVYAAWASGGNMMLHKFSNCDAGLVPQVGWPITVAAFTNVACPVPGLDRCNGRNILSSPKVAVDDLDPQHIYYAFATSTGAGNEDVMVFDSTDGGATFPRSVRVNNAVPGRRYMPWISTYGGIAAVSWYDRRTATAANNDLTRYFIGGAAVRGPNLVALAETDLSGIDDAECSTWPCATNAQTDSESCSLQPQAAGRCFMTVTPNPVGSGNPCDFSSPTCPAGETCFIGRGCPKYGDYNGNAAGAGRLYSAWSSATPPVGAGGAGGTISVYASADRIPSDFYVRDWSDSPTVFDNGAQPSTHFNFWSTSDVWNQSTNIAAAAGPDGSVVGDPPSRSGSNFAFARVSRRAPAMSTAPDATVTVNFFLGDFGLGNPFTPIGTEDVILSATDMAKITPAHSWAVPGGASNHLCLAVEIVGPDGDTFAMPDINGIAPGPANAFIVNDNNKAQRNLQDTIGTADGTELIAMIGNSERKSRLLRLRIKIPRNISLTGTVDVIGGKQFKLTNDTRIEIGSLRPREVRWLRFRVTNLAGIDKPTPIDVFEDTNPPANGFTIRLHRDSVGSVARRNLADLAGVFSRLAQIEENPTAKKLAELALRASQEVTKDSYAAFLSKNRAGISEIIAKHLGSLREKDQFEIEVAVKQLWNALDEKNVDRAASNNTALTERLDAHLTALWRAKHSMR